MQNISIMDTLPPQQITTDVLLEKYCKGDETSADQIYRRVAKHLASVEATDELKQKWEELFYGNMKDGAIGAGRIMSAAGTDLKATLLNCYVVAVGDSIDGYDEDGVPGIYEALRQAAITMQKGGGVGYNFSKIRPRGSWVKSVNSEASGPCSYMDIFDSSCKTIESAGFRRGAMLSALNIDHPDVFEFIKAKRTPGRWNNFNVSVVVTDKFMKAKNNGEMWQLVHKAKPSQRQIDSGAYQRDDGLWVYATVSATELWDAIMRSNYDYAEPGILFYDNINNDNNLWYVETIEATNPCVTGDTLILTDKGNVRIDSVVDQEITIWNGNQWSKVTPRVTGENQVIYIVQFDDGTVLNCTPYHKFILNGGGRLQAKQLRLGDVLSNYIDPISGKMTPEPSVVAMSIRMRLESKVYCFNEPINHSGVFNGVLTGNCGEVPIPPNGCCDLGPIILPKLVKHPFTTDAAFDFAKLVDMVKIQVRMLDNVLDATVWPLKQQQEEAMRKRRIGVGFTGLANALAMLNVVYYSDAGLAVADAICSIMKNAAYEASSMIAAEKGSFPAFDVDKFLKDGTSASRLPDSIKDLIRKYGIRNSHLLSIAPTGTVSLAFADNASNGIEPPYSLAYTRKKRTGEGHVTYNVLDHSLRVFLSTIPYPDLAKSLEDAICNYKETFDDLGTPRNIKSYIPESLVTALEMTTDQHLAMMKVVQPYICQSISKTVNVPKDASFEEFKTIYDHAWDYKLKGVSTYRPNDILGSVLSVEAPKKEEKKEPPKVKTVDANKVREIVDRLYSQPFTGRSDGVLTGLSTKGRFYTEHGEQKFIITINFTDSMHTEPGLGTVKISRPTEFLLVSNFQTSSSVWQASMRFMSLMARSGVPIPKIIENMKEVTWEHGKVRFGTREKDGRQIPLWHDSDVAAIGHSIQQALINVGYLTQEGELDKPYSLMIDGQPAQLIGIEEVQETVTTEHKEPVPTSVKGKTCPECGADALAKRDGCETCSECGYVGSCG